MKIYSKGDKTDEAFDTDVLEGYDNRHRSIVRRIFHETGGLM